MSTFTHTRREIWIPPPEPVVAPPPVAVPPTKKPPRTRGERVSRAILIVLGIGLALSLVRC